MNLSNYDFLFNVDKYGINKTVENIINIINSR